MPRASAIYTQELSRLHGGQSVSKTMIVALRLSRMYRNKPTYEMLMRDFGMSRATAYRWLAAWQYVHESANDAKRSSSAAPRSGIGSNAELGVTTRNLE